MRPIDEARQDSVHIAGTPDEMIATLHEYEEAGLDQLGCVFLASKMDEKLAQMCIFS